MVLPVGWFWGADPDVGLLLLFVAAGNDTVRTAPVSSTTSSTASSLNLFFPSHPVAPLLPSTHPK
jgi:hypothetical protein